MQRILKYNTTNTITACMACFMAEKKQCDEVLNMAEYGGCHIGDCWANTNQCFKCA